MQKTCPICYHQTLEYRFSQPSLKGGAEYDVYRCYHCGTFAEDTPEYSVLAEDVSASAEERPDCGEGMNW